jgi:hypothetical protein
MLVLSITSVFFLGLAGCGSQQRAKTNDQWQAMARADLDAAHKLIVEAHPGMLDEQNPDFVKWVESGYREALDLLPKVFSYDSARSAVRYYVAGFRDGHLHYSDGSRSDSDRIVTTGWNVDLTGRDYRVSAVAPSWPSALPPIGAKLIECDGRTPDKIVEQDVAPFVDMRDLLAVRLRLARPIGLLHMAGMEIKRCQFQGNDGTVNDLPISYQGITFDQYWEWIFVPTIGKPPRRTNGFEFNNGVLWIHAANFDLDPQDARELESMLVALHELKGIKTIVFDARGNRGGDSGVGDRIIEAAAGTLEFDLEGIDQLPRTYAQWRVSNLAITNAAEGISRKVALYGSESQQAKYFQLLYQNLMNASQVGQQWVEQPGGNLVNRLEVAKRHGHLSRFQGKVALITDMNCASACLDFADYVRLVPGAVHFGEITSADSVYIESPQVKLPSGNNFAIPLKVWRNRIRGNNEALVPDVPIDLASLEESMLATRVLSALEAVQ